jgi:Peptidase family M23
MKERTQLSLKLILSHVILFPVLILISPFINSDSFLLLTITQTVFIILFFSGYWEFFGLRFTRVYFSSSELIILIVLLWKLFSAHKTENNLYLIIILAIIQAWLLFLLIKIIIVIFVRDKETFEIDFPFKNGRYLITDGGNSKISRLMNYHFYSSVHKKKRTNLSMLFATDIVKIGNTGKLFLPPHNEDYPIFEENVFSPIDGVVYKVENGIDDNIPFCGSYPYNTGNTIVIRKGNYYLLLGHLKKDSILVHAGDNINADQVIAKAGNSGYSERPHLHMQLIHSTTENYWIGKGISTQFKKKNLYKNRVIDV